MRTKLLNLALAMTLSSAALIANAAPTYTLSILDSEPSSYPDLSSYTQLSRPDGANSRAKPMNINDFGVIVGNITNGTNKDFATFWASLSSPYTQLQSLGGAAKEGLAFDINNSGNIVGYSQNATNVWQATLWTSANPNSPTLLQSVGGAEKSGIANWINNSEQIVGMSFNTDTTNYYLLSNANTKATLWYGTNVTDLNTYLDTSNNPDGWVLTDAWRIDNDGSIYGDAFNSTLNQNKYFSLQSVNPVPEADTSAMLLTGLGVMGFMVRRRKNT